MYTTFGRVLLILLASALVGTTWRSQPWAAVLAIVGACLVGIGYFRAGTVWLAWRALKAGDTARTERLLQQMKYPQWLSRQNKAYYHFAKGIIALERKNASEAAPELAMAASLGPRTENDRCLLLAYQAGAAHLNNELLKAEEYLAVARRLNANQGVMDMVTRVSDEIRKDSVR